MIGRGSLRGERRKEETKEKEGVCLQLVVLRSSSTRLSGLTSSIYQSGMSREGSVRAREREREREREHP